MTPKRAIAEAAARHIHSTLGISTPDDLDLPLIAADNEAMIRERALRGADGMMVRMGAKAVISVRDSIPETGKKRFVAAHELGHVLLHPEIKQWDKCALGEVDRLSYRQSPEELEANYFAAELLMPQLLFAGAMWRVDPAFSEIQRLADLFNTTLSATAIQYIKYTREPCAFLISKDLQKPWFFTTERFGFFIENREKVHSYSVTADTVKQGRRSGSNSNYGRCGAIGRVF